ncbi:MAG: hypothetical protein SV765_00215 [Pseudomonadota bacterium]|nr:hypothetical protein [Pseudomonadota bacterium]
MPISDKTLDRRLQRMVNELQESTGLSEEEIKGVAENAFHRKNLENLNFSEEEISKELKNGMEGALHFMISDDVAGMFAAVEARIGFTPSQSAQIFKGSGGNLEYDVADLLSKEAMIDVVKQAGDLSNAELAEALEGEGRNLEPALKILHAKLNPDQPELSRLDQKMTSFVERLNAEKGGSRNR